MPNKKLLSIGGLITIILLAAGVAVMTVYMTKRTVQVIEETQVETHRGLAPAPKIDTSNWKTYRNEEYGFELKYPTDWEISERGDNYAFAKIFYIKKIMRDPRYIFPPDILINPTEESEPDLCYSSFAKVRKGEFDFAGRKTTAWVFFTEEGDVWRLIIKNIPDLPENWNKDAAIHVNYPVYSEKVKDCEYGDQFVYCPIGLESIKVACAVDKKESEVFNQILSTFKFIEH